MIAFSVDNATGSPCFVVEWSFVRKNHAVFDDFKAQLFIDEIILVKDTLRGFRVVKIIEVRHDRIPVASTAQTFASLNRIFAAVEAR